jgi:hypothetical protein
MLTPSSGVTARPARVYRKIVSTLLSRRTPASLGSRARHEGLEICQISGKNTGDLGVIEAEHPRHGKVRFTSLERTLIDAAVRPEYAGGPEVVLQAYAAGAAMASPKRIADLLEQLDHTYPYHQVIGFYLERSGRYVQEAVDLFRRQPMEFDFYLDRCIPERAYSARWRLYYPRELGEAE